MKHGRPMLLSWGNVGGCGVNIKELHMRDGVRGIIAGLGAWKLGGGCFSTILIFILLYWLLGNF